MFEFDAYRHRPAYFRDISLAKWQNWLWQQQNAISNWQKLQKVFPHLEEKWLEAAKIWDQRGLRFLLTPYVLSLVSKDIKGNPKENDVIWRQVFPAFDGLLHYSSANKGLTVRPDEYSPKKENWEEKKEMITPIAQHKYDNRVIIYTADVCLGYCVFCFRSLQSNAKQEKHGGKPFWKQTIEAIRARPQIEEVIFSGGDPLVFDNASVEAMLKDIRGISTVKAIRIHTRAWLHNPYRIDNVFCALLKKYEVTEMGVHTVHPKELTKDFKEAVERIRASGAHTLLMSDTPLIKGVNDDEKTLRELFMNLYLCGVKPYYLSHNMPNIPAAAAQRTSVRKGVRLMNRLKRRISNTAMPEYIIAQETGKKTVPESECGTPDFRYEKDKTGWPIIRFKNWKGRWVTYLDTLD